MKFKIYALAALLILLAGCNMNESNSSKKPAPADPKTDSPTTTLVHVQPQSAPESGQYCYIRQVYTRDGADYIDADYIQFLMGKAAVAAAKKNGEAEMTVGHNGDTSWSVPDDYYILNENPKVRTLPLARNFEYLAVAEGETAVKKPTLEFLKSAIKDNVFILTVNGNGEVTRIKQQYVP